MKVMLHFTAEVPNMQQFSSFYMYESCSSLSPTGGLKLGFDSVFKSVVFHCYYFFLCLWHSEGSSVIKCQRFLMSYVIACYQGKIKIVLQICTRLVLDMGILSLSPSYAVLQELECEINFLFSEGFCAEEPDGSQFGDQGGESLSFLPI